MGDQRKYRRVAASLPLQCTLLPERKVVFSTTCKNISTVGLKILSRDFIPRGDVLKLEINLISAIAHVKAHVVWCNQKPFSDDYFVGLEIIEVDSDELKTINEYIDQVCTGLVN